MCTNTQELRELFLPRCVSVPKVKSTLEIYLTFIDQEVFFFLWWLFDSKQPINNNVQTGNNITIQEKQQHPEVINLSTSSRGEHLEQKIPFFYYFYSRPL